MPAWEALQRVAAEHPPKLLRARLAQLAQGVEGVGRARAAQLEVGDFQAAAALADGGFNHCVAVARGGDGAAALHPGVAGGDQQHAVELEGDGRGVGEVQVGAVDGIKGAAEHADALVRAELQRRPGGAQRSHSQTSSLRPTLTRSPGCAPARCSAAATPRRSSQR